MRAFLAAIRPASQLFRLFVLPLLALAASLAWAAPGDLISKTLTPIPGNENKTYAMALQPDGKIVTAGYAYFGTRQFAITRYNADGTVDTTFADAGTRLEPLAAGDSEAHGIGLQSDGKIVVAGFSVSDVSHFGLARFNTDGSLDTSFGGGGALSAIGTGSAALAMAVQPDDKIVLGGWSIQGGKKVFTIARYAANSPTLEMLAVAPAGAVDEQVNALAIQADGKIVAAGSAGNGQVVVRRYNADGSLDTSFAIGGAFNTTSMAGGRAVSVLPGGAILVAGELPGTGTFEVMRLTAAGALDTTFGVSGFAQQGTGGSTGQVGGMQVQSDGKIVVAGTGLASAPAFAAARFNADGSNDTGFGNSGLAIHQFSFVGDEGYAVAILGNGFVAIAGAAGGTPADCACTPTTTVKLGALVAFNASGVYDDTHFHANVIERGSKQGAARASALQFDGKLVVAGWQRPTPGVPSVLSGTLMRYNADGSLDTTFGTGGIVSTGADQLRAVAIQPDGRIVAAGYAQGNFQGNPATHLYVVRLNSDGSSDTTFGTSGAVAISADGPTEEANALALQSDGKIVLGGVGQLQGGFTDALFVRLDSVGRLDTSFGGTGKVRVAMSTGNDQANALAIQSDGKILGAGWGQVSGSQDSVMVARLNTDGSLDSAFGTGGIATTTIGTTTAHGNAIVLQPDGKLVVGGQWFNPGSTVDDLLVARYNADGSLDGSFGTNGVTTTDLGNHARTHALALMPSGKIAAAGDCADRFCLQQYLSTGVIDTSFGNRGFVSIPMNSGGEVAWSLVLRSDGNLWVSGDASSMFGAAIVQGDGSAPPPPASATVSLASSANPSQEGQSITFTASVAGNSGTPTGGVTFMNGSSAMCSNVALANGVATCPVIFFNTGTFTITANYSGDGTYGAASTTFTQTVNAASGTASVNAALASSGSVATASSTYSSTYGPANAINGDRTGAFSKGGIWLDGTRSAFPDWFQVQFASAQTIDHVIVYSMQDGTPVEPTDTMTFAKYGVVDFQVQAWNGSSWVTVGSVSGNNLVKRTVTFPQVSTDRIRVLITYALGGSSRLAEVEAWTVGSTSSTHVPTVDLSSSANPSNQGDAVTFTATVSGSAGAPTGSVTFLNDTTEICAAVPLSAGTATCTTSSITAGQHSITARYSGDSTYDGASHTIVQTVNSSGANATVALASSANPSNFGDTVTFTATVSGSAGTPTGSVTFLDGSITLCNAVALSSGQATCSSGSLSSGSHSITANYSGNGTYPSAASSPLTQTVNSANAPLNVALATQGAIATASSSYSSTYGPANAINGDRTGAASKGNIWLDGTRSAFPDWLQVQFVGTETIGRVVVYSMQDSTPVEPTDTMTFTKYGVVDFQVQVWNGSAWVTTASVTGNNLVKRTVTFTPVATDRIRVLITYALGGSSRLAEVEAWTAGGTTSTATATVALASSANPSNVGDAVTFTATVSGSAGTPTGNVTFIDGSSTICSSVPLSSGQATCTTSSLSAGTHSIVAQYLGDATYPSASSDALSQSVSSGSSATASVALTSSANPSTFGQSVTFTANVGGASGTATGTVTFDDNGSPLCSAVSLASGIATCTTSFLSQGTHAITAAYSGDGTYGPASSSALSQVVNAASGSSTNVALASAGAAATASSTYSSAYSPANAINGDRTGGSMSGGIWLDATRSAFPDWLQVQFAATQSIDRVVVYSMQDNYGAPVDPSDTMTFTKFGIVDFQVQAWNGSAWVTVASVAGNNLVKRTVTFSPVSTDRIRVLITQALGGSSRLAEVEAWVD